MSRRTLIFLSLLPAVLLVHAPVLLGGYVWDDHVMITGNPELGDLGNIPAMFQRNYFGERANVELYRPLVNVTLALDFGLWGGANAAGFHLTNLVLHLLGGVLLYFLLRRLSVRPWFAELGAMIFLLHPASAEPVAWIVGRGDLLAFVLSMATILLHLAGRKRPALHLLALLAFTLAVFGKLAAAPVPLLILLIEGTVRGLKVRDLLRPRNLLRYASYALPVVLYAFVRAEAMGSLLPQSTGVTLRGVDSLPVVTIGAALLFRYASIFLVPLGLCADYSADPVFDVDLVTGIAGSAPVFLMAGGAVGLIALALWARRRAPFLALGALWFFAALLPVSQVVRIGAVMADRYLYLPAAGGAIFLSMLLLRLPRARAALGLVVLLCLTSLTVAREAVWRSDRTMSEDVLRASNYPGDADAVNRLGLTWQLAGDVEKEEAAYRRGLELDPDNRYLRKNLGAVLLETGRIEEALGVLTQAFQLPQAKDRQKASIAYNLSLALIALGKEPAAALVLEEAVTCHPPLALAYERLGRLYRDRLDRPQRGEDLIRQAMEIREREARAGR